jgi:hypothetical protein
MANTFDAYARFFDLVFAIGFAIEAVLYIIRLIKGTGSFELILTGYYIFFSLFMFGCTMKLNQIKVNFGFLRSIFYTSLFYIL